MTHAFSDVRAFRRDPLRFLLDRGNRAPVGLERLHLGPKPVLLVTDPALIRPMLKAPETEIGKGRLIRKLQPILGQSSLMLHGEKHKRRRDVLQKRMAKGAVERYLPELCAEIRAVGAKIGRLGCFDPHRHTAALALRTICIAVFGTQLISAGDEQALVQAVGMIEDDLADDMFRVLPVGPVGWYRQKRRRDFAKLAMSTVVQRLRERAGSASVLKDLEDLGLTDEELHDEILTLLLAGHHTTGTTAAWILYHLAVDPDLMQSIAAEASECADGSGELRADAVRRAELSATLVREVCRLYPGAWWFSREVMSSTTIAGHKLAKGTSLLISPWQLQRDPRYWDQPDQFLMDRTYSTDAYLPFGAGPRACAGMGVAMLELQLLALEMAAAFRFTSVTPNPPPRPKASVTLIPPPMSIEVELRADAGRCQSVMAWPDVQPARSRAVGRSFW
ncbi:cytochrome P450 [Rhodopseudomonas rhenobacensis]|uniref:Cytochrome P450 n=1 Tax=Rhodopseudomonas rhenobacensis TaxID=87461 RepID=A0A7W7Z2P3_9BRAD|nr:cytochrome P450 [Rhodopseudomonas rhenobacensis]MBB5046871.1 cytochrome P450 [Rhodopseudomonas rhenobacensis]